MVFNGLVFDSNEWGDCQDPSATDNFEVACVDAVGKNCVLGGERKMLDWPLGVHVVVADESLNFICRD